MVTRRDAFAGFAALGAGALVQGPESTLRVGVVDLFRVLQDAKPFHEMDGQLKAWIDQAQKPLKAMQAEMRELEAKLDLLEPKGEEAKKLARDLEHKKVEFAYELNARDVERLARVKSARTSGFEQARQAIAQVAKDRGIQIVLQARGGELAGESEAAIATEIYLRSVLYADGTLDITSDVLSVLNR